jgi:probable HAF family extracellular repeat protein
MRDLGTLGGTADETSIATDVNDAGQVIGLSTSHSTAERRDAFLYQDGTMRKLGALIDPALRWTIVFAAVIDDRGQIAATAFTGGSKPHAVLLTPPAK